MLIKLLVAVAALVIVLAMVITLQPSQFRMARSTAVAAPASAAFAQVNDFHIEKGLAQMKALAEGMAKR